ncbi:ATP-binding protein [Minwuia sp.]|uniref:ATP-binding protein n=1 Tax=Minwuia sp. TaxID=2493630 RepID=UPI003A95DE74
MSEMIREDASVRTDGLVTVALGAVAVLLLATLGVEMTRAAGNVASIWLANALALGIILRVGGALRYAAFALSGTAIFLANLAYGDTVTVSLGLTIANLLEIACSALILNYMRFRRRDILTPEGFFRFLLVAGLAGPIVGAVAGALALNHFYGAPFLAVFQTWVASGIVGAVIIGPAVIAPVQDTLKKRRWFLLTEAALWIATIFALVWVVHRSSFDLLIYAMPALIVFAGIRLGMPMSGLVGSCLAISLIWSEIGSADPASRVFGGNILEIQVFLLAQIALAHVVALLWHQRGQVERRMQDYVRAVEGSQDGILFVDPDDRFTAWNRAMAQFFPDITQVPAGGRQAFHAQNSELLRRLREGEVISDLRLTRPDGKGESREILLNAAPVFRKDVYEGATVTVRDVTREERLNRVAQERAAELEAFVDATSDAVVGTDADGIINVWNRSAAVFYDLPAEKALGSSILDVKRGSDRETRAANMARLARGEEIRNSLVIRGEDDSVERQVELAINPIFDAERNFTGTATVMRDVTDLLQTASQRDEAEKLLAVALSSITDAIAIYDADEKLVVCNTAYAEMIGLEDPAACEGQAWEWLLRNNLAAGDIALAPEAWDSWIEDRRNRRREGGRPFVMNVRGDTWLLGNDYPIAGGGFITVRQDISDLKRVEKQLERSNAELEQFAFVASHDMQEPLRKIMAFSGILDEEFADVLPEKGRKYLGFVTSASQRMQTLIQDLLAYSRLDSGHGKKETTDLGDLARQALQNLSEAAREAGGEIEIQDLGMAETSPAEMTRVFQNLIGNAIKYRKPDTPLKVVVTRDWGIQDQVVIRVADNGIGFDMKHARQILEPFKRLHAHSSIPGTGMGLSIVAKIVRNMGGDVVVETATPDGATFRLSWPVHAPGESGLPTARGGR